MNSSTLVTHKIFVNRDAIRETSDCLPVVILGDDGEAVRCQSVEISGPSRVIFSPHGFKFGEAVVRIWIETNFDVIPLTG